MRVLIPALGGILIGIALAAIFRPFVDGDLRKALRLASELTALRDENADLRARLAAEVDVLLCGPSAAGESETEARPEEEPPTEAEGHKERDAAGGRDTLPNAEVLASLLEAKDMKGLYRALENLLLSGEEGFPAFLQFLREGMKPPRYALWQDRGLSFLLMRLAFLREEEVARLARYLLGSLDPKEDAALRQQLLRFLPPFLASLGDGQSELRRELEGMLFSDFEDGSSGTNLWATAQAMREMGLEVPVDTLGAILADAGRSDQHWLALQQLAQRGDDASVDLMLKYLSTSQGSQPQGSQPWMLRNVYQMLGNTQNRRAEEAVLRATASPDAATRDAASLAYFSRQRTAESYPLAFGYLESDGGVQEKRMLLWQLRNSSREVFDAIQLNAESLSSQEVRKLVEEVASGRVQWGTAAPGAAAGAPGGAAPAVK